jgi:hypothetical protein
MDAGKLYLFPTAKQIRHSLFVLPSSLLPLALYLMLYWGAAIQLRKGAPAVRGS